jgi:hypothetical protein
MDPIHSEGNARCLVALLLNKRLDKANDLSKEADPRQDLKRASMTTEEIEKNSIANPGWVIEVPNL